MTPPGVAPERLTCQQGVVPNDGRGLQRLGTIGMIPLWGELAGSAGLGAVWGWLLVQLTAASRPSLPRLIVPLIATGALLGTVLVLTGISGVVVCGAAIGAAAVLHAALYARLRLQAGSLEPFEITEGGPR